VGERRSQMSWRCVQWRGLVVVAAVVVLGVLAAGAAQAQPSTNFFSTTPLSVHPNERAPGDGSGAIRIGTAPWTSSGLIGTWYTFKIYKFCETGTVAEEYGYCLKVRVTAQNYSKTQNSQGLDDRLWMKIDGSTPNDVFGVQSGPVGQYQWKGNTDAADRKTLEFQFPGGLSAGNPGEHTIKFEAKNTPIIWWVEVEQFHCCQCTLPG
jgi:hypothetical protein